MTFRIGPVELDNSVFLAPMSGVSDQPFRRLAKRYGAGLVYSEMIASQAMVRANDKTQKMATNCEEERPIAVQLAGCEPEIMAEAARMNEGRGASIIDINMGCPVKKVTKGDAGSALMKDELLASKIVAAVVKAVSLPVTVKMRLGWDHQHLNAPQLAKMLEGCGAVAITVHGRTRNQFYKGQADWSAIRQVKEAISVPLIGNGDVEDIETAKQMLEQSGADGVMVGRGTYGKPWLPGQIAQYLKTGEVLPEPSIAERRSVLLEHLEMMLEHYGEYGGLRIARKHLSWYSKGLHGSAEFRSDINKIDHSKQVVARINEFFAPLLESAAE
ncbi:MAG: tRNA dihydrouridine synthase DusB [Alphaproteobacteria bacterium]|nr:tRNA dihydrouridine synthase DusB [Rhodospirillales bacterium]MCW9046033.1 tRNA dihydrouridine synthase DusB [Alphaproteobacteria bacterium]